MIQVRIVDSSELVLWDNYVLSCEGSTPYHFSAWNASIEAAYGHKTYNLIAEKDNKICGVLPLCHIKIPLISNTLCSLPYCDISGVLANNKETRCILLNTALALSKELDVDFLEIRERSLNSDEFSITEELKNHKVSMLLKLPDSSDILLNNFKSKLRSQIRKAEKNGLTFKYGRDEYFLQEFYNVFSQNMKYLGSPTHSLKWFDEIRKQYSDNMIFGIVNMDNKVLAGCILLTLNNIAVIPWASTLNIYNRLSPNMLLYWNILKHACDCRCQIFDFGRSTYGEGTYKFKQQWGAEPYPLSWIKYDTNGSIILDNTSQIISLRPIAENIWSLLPLAVTNAIGPLVRKYISL